MERISQKISVSFSAPMQTLGSEAALMIEGSREASEGARVRLNVTSLLAPGGPGVRLFPGQVGEWSEVWGRVRSEGER
jgi:hypothetical protein